MMVDLLDRLFEKGHLFDSEHLNLVAATIAFMCIKYEQVNIISFAKFQKVILEDLTLEKIKQTENDIL